MGGKHASSVPMAAGSFSAAQRGGALFVVKVLVAGGLSTKLAFLLWKEERDRQTIVATGFLRHRLLTCPPFSIIIHLSTSSFHAVGENMDIHRTSGKPSFRREAASDPDRATRASISAQEVLLG